jgi:hypothetical protein
MQRDIIDASAPGSGRYRLLATILCENATGNSWAKVSFFDTLCDRIGHRAVFRSLYESSSSHV